MKRLIGVDIDEVLSETLPVFLDFLKHRYQIHLTPDHFHSTRWWDILGETREENNKRVLEFHDSDHFTTVLPISGSQLVTKDLAKTHKLIAITARDDRISKVTLDWIEQHYPGVFSDVIFTNHFSGHKHQMTKGEACKNLGVSLFLEDNDDFAHQVAEQGIKTLLFDYPWNRKLTHPHITRVKSWAEAHEHIKKK